MGYVDNYDHMANSYLTNWHSFKWPMKLFFIFLHLTVLNSLIQLSSCGAKYAQRFQAPSGEKFDWKAGKSQDRPTSRLVGGQTWLQQMLCDSRAAITNNGHRNHPPNSAAISVHLMARERAQCICAPHVMWACALCHRISYQNKFVNHPTLWTRHVMIKLWSKVPQTFCSKQNYVSNELLTPHFI
jgi:hypothetical protein